MSSLAAVNSQMNYVNVWRTACRIVQWTLTEKVHIGWIHCEKSLNIFYMYINIVHKYIMRVVLRFPFVFPLSKTTVLITSRLLVLYQRDRLASYKINYLIQSGTFYTCTQRHSSRDKSLEFSKGFPIHRMKFLIPALTAPCLNYSKPTSYERFFI